MKRCKKNILIAVLVLLPVVVGMPSISGQAAEPGSGWLPWGDSDGDFRTDVVRPEFYSSHVTERSGLSHAEMDALLDTMADVLAIVKQTPALNPPQGVEIEPARHILPRKGDGGRARGILWLIFWVPSRERADHFSGQIEVVVNDGFRGGPYVGTDEHGSIHRQFPVISELNGYRVYAMSDRDTALAVVPQERTFWQPVSQERWIRYIIDSTREYLEEVKDSVVSTQEHRAQGGWQDFMAEIREGLDLEALAGLLQ